MDLKEALESICGLILAAKIGLVRRPILDSGGSTYTVLYLRIFPIESWAFSDADLDAFPGPKSAQQVC